MAQTRKSSPRREQVLGEATRLFAHNGFQGTSVRCIASACGISEAAIYRHFEGKADLYEAAIHRKSEAHDIAGHLKQITRPETIDDVLGGIAEHILSYLDSDPELLGLMFNNSCENGPVAAVLFKEVRLPYIEYLAGELKQRIATGEVRKVDPFITARCFVGMVMDCALSVDVWRKVIEFDFHASDVIANNVPIFARGLLKEAGTSDSRH
jgi:AcrR family transcriptional regulator